MHLLYHIKWYILIIIFFLLDGCATYYTKNLQFQEQFVSGNIDAADKTLSEAEQKVKPKDILLFYLNKGVVQQMLGNYTESNRYFEQAYIYVEDFKKNIAAEAASLITNPSIKPYSGEDHEVVLIHYYMALNYIMMGDLNEALVECRRINHKLTALFDKYEYKKYRYKVDAFAHNLMGIIYDATRDANNAFIAYRNAYNAYNEIYKGAFNVSVPEQLKHDLLRTAYLNGFREELRKYENEFNIKYTHEKKPGQGELIFFWHNGMGPVKGEWSINFAIQKGQGGAVMFVNDEMGLSFPFVVSSASDRNKLSDLGFIRIAFPKYIERKPVYHGAYIKIDNGKYDLAQAENINAIAFTTLEDRMLREMANSLLRLALKQIAEQQVRKENEGLGMLVSAVNAATEKADTRNWQTLPYFISYTRIPLNEGTYRAELNVKGQGQVNRLTDFNITVSKNKSVFHLYHNLESYAPGINR
jgi:hypothetical protein